jgi:hypothetical protein
MLRDLSLEHINAAVNAIGITAKHHRCEHEKFTHEYPGVHPIFDESGRHTSTFYAAGAKKEPVIKKEIHHCYRPDIVEFFDKSGEKKGTLVEPKKIFSWNTQAYRIETVWDIKRIIENHE